MKPNFKFEMDVNKKGQHTVVGVDEVGRGALAGPVVAGAVCLVSRPFFRAQSSEGREPALPADRHEKMWGELGINDSKKLSPNKRRELDKIIRRQAVAWGIGEASAAYIDRYGIVSATAKAMRQAVKNCHQANVYLLIDAFHVKYVPGVGLKNQKAIIKGDEKSLSIAAASIIAKVHRDRLMDTLHKKYPRYHWRANKGYGTSDHVKAIKRLGPCRLHRRSFMLKI